MSILEKIAQKLQVSYLQESHEDRPTDEDNEKKKCINKYKAANMMYPYAKKNWIKLKLGRNMPRRKENYALYFISSPSVVSA